LNIIKPWSSGCGVESQSHKLYGVSTLEKEMKIAKWGTPKIIPKNKFKLRMTLLKYEPYNHLSSVKPYLSDDNNLTFKDFMFSQGGQ
jgi:hypothetical protein